MSKCIFFLAKLKEGGRPFLDGASIDLNPLNYLLHMGVILAIIHHPLSTVLTAYGNREYPGRFQSKSVRPSSNESPSIFSSLPN